jgi:tetratricopeptide (TPR) repeat protein
MSLLGKWFGFTKDEVFDEGVSAYDRGDYEAAVDAFEECLGDAPDNSTARLSAFYCGESYAQLGNRCFDTEAFVQAARFFEAALRYCPNYPDVRLRAAKSYDKLGEFDCRDEHLEAALKINPRYVDALVFRGVCAYAEGRHDEGLESVREACDIDPELDCDQYHLALRHHAEGDFGRALANLRHLSLCVSNDSALHKRVGDSFLRDGLYEEAAIAYRRAIQITPRFAEAHARLAQALAGQRRFADAVTEIDHAIKINPTSAEAHAQKGSILRAMEQEIDARCEFRKAAELDPNHPAVLREGVGVY